MSKNLILGLSFFLATTCFARSELKIPDILDASALNTKMDPCQDFYQFSCGNWIKNTEIPGDKSIVMHQSTALIDQTDKNLNKLLVAMEKNDPKLKTQAGAQVLDYYDSCMNYVKTAPTSMKRLKDEIEAIEKVKNKSELTPLLAHLHLLGTNAFFTFGSGQSLKDSTQVIGFVDQGGMGLPEPSYYLEKDPKSVETRAKYLEHVTKIFKLLGAKKEAAEKNAKTVLKLETDLATHAFSFDDRQDPAKINHPVTLAELNKTTPAIDWALYFKMLGAPESALNLNEPAFFNQLNATLQATPIEELKTYLIWHITHRSANEINPAFEQVTFDFWSTYLRGEKKMKPRWKECTQMVENRLDYALGEVYVKTVDTVAIKVKIESMIDWIKQTFRDDLTDLSHGKDAWLDEATAKEALHKLSLLSQKVGSPEKWRNYDSLKTGRESYLQNDYNVVTFEARRDLAKIGKPVDRDEWNMMPWVINAYYDPPKNEFVFPFGILQPPSFDLKASDGANLGSFGGGTIGHELTHGYDNDGRQYDANGNFKDWWTESTKKRYEEKSECFIKQANAYEIKEAKLFVDGKKTLPENLADQGGVKLGYAALIHELGKRAPSKPWIGKYTENQQYWIAYAQSWCAKPRAETLRVQIKTNPHPPAEFRVNGVVMNRPEFAKDFGCKENAPMAPVNRCSIW